jgi:hypothetical protein
MESQKDNRKHLLFQSVNKDFGGGATIFAEKASYFNIGK